MVFDWIKQTRTSRTRKDKRLSLREETAEAVVEIWGDTYPVKNWSNSGFLAASCTLDRKEGDEVEIDFSVPLRYRRLEFNCRALVVKVDKDKQELAAMFVMIDDWTRQKIDAHFADSRNFELEDER